MEDLTQYMMEDVVKELKSQCIEIIKEFISVRMYTESRCCIHSAKFMLTKTDNTTLIELHVKYDDDEVFMVPVGETKEAQMELYLSSPIGHYINIDDLMRTFADSRCYELTDGSIMKH